MAISLNSIVRAATLMAPVALALLGGEPLAAGDFESEWKSAPFKIERVAPQENWVGATIKPEQWQPVDQPDLAEQLKTAKVLEYEAFAPAPQRCWFGERPFLVPNPDGKSWDMVYPYFNVYMNEQEMVIHDFGTGKTRHQFISKSKRGPGTGDSALTRENIGFHMRPSFYTAGKLVFDHYGAVKYSVYDPVEDKFVHGAKPFGETVVSGRGVLGDDGMVYGMGWEASSTQFVAYRFDPKTYEAKRYKAFGPANRNRKELYAVVEMHGDWLYAEIGNEPWHTVAFNVKTEESRLLAQTRNILGTPSTIQIWNRDGGMAGVMFDAAMIDGIKDVTGEKFEFWLYDGRIHPRTDAIPPWSDKPAVEKKPKSFPWMRDFQQWPDDFTAPGTPPLIEKNSGQPDAYGNVQLKYRMRGQTETLEYTVKLYPGVVQMLTEVNEDVLTATDAGYGQQVFYDIATKTLMPVGGFVSPYSIGHLNNRLYVSGYPNMQVFEYDFTREIGPEHDNPKRVAWLGHKNETHLPIAGTVGAADGRVYAAGITYGRQRVGGGWGWCDPKTGEIGGAPLPHRFFWMTAADHGRYVLMSTKLDAQGQLMGWDTRQEAFIYQKEILDQPTPGPLVEALPGGLVIGHTGDEKGSGILYGLRADTGDILWQKPVPNGPITAQSLVKNHSYSFRRGPDGYIWAFFGVTLVRINPISARVEVVGRMPDAANQIAFAGDQIVVAGADHVRRIKNLRTQKAPTPH